MKHTNKIKELTEKRTALLAHLDTMLDSLESGNEVRAFTDEEQAEYTEKKKQAEALGNTISALREQRDMEEFTDCTDADNGTKDSENEERAFENYLRHSPRALP